MTPDALWEAIADALAEVDEANATGVSDMVRMSWWDAYATLQEMRAAGLVTLRRDHKGVCWWRLA